MKCVKELEERNPLHTFPINAKRFCVFPFPTKVHDYFLRLGSVQGEIVVLGTSRQSADLPVDGLVSPGDEANDGCVAYLTMVSVGWAGAAVISVMSI